MLTSDKQLCVIAAFSDDGNFIATGSQDTSLKVLDATVIMSRDTSGDEKKVIKTLYDHTGPVNEVAFHPNGAVLASCSGKCLLILLFNFNLKHDGR